MTVQSFIPIWLMAIVCVFLVVLKRKSTASFIRQIIIAILLFALNLRIAIPSEEVEREVTNVDVLFVVDTTISMVAEDYDGDNPRMNGVKSDIMSIAEGINGARYSIITFDNFATRLLPYTDYVEPLEDVVNAMHTQTEYYAEGTSLNAPMSEMEIALKRDEDSENDPSIHVVIFITDGEDTSGRALKSYESLAENVDCGAVLGYGTSEGGKMRAPSFNGDENPAYLYYYDDNFNYKEGVSQIDEDNLETIADDLGIEYFHMTKPGDVEDVIDSIKSDLDDSDIKTVKVKSFGYIETYYFFAIGLAAFLIYDAFWYKRKLRYKV